jgi:tetrahydromethanopterin S-methyltransferase subunit D
MIKINRFVALSVALLSSLIATAQDTKPEMADAMRANGKIYVVVAVCLTILVGLFVYVYNVDRKIKKIEQHQ